jgi:hypothetical protein
MLGWNTDTMAKHRVGKMWCGNRMGGDEVTMRPRKRGKAHTRGVATGQRVMR